MPMFMRQAAIAGTVIAAQFALAAQPEPPPAAPAPEVAPVPADLPAGSLAATLAEREAAQQTFARLAEEERYEEAVAVGAQIVDLTRRVYGEKSPELAAPLSNLATAQMRRGDLPGAETNYRASIAIIETADGVSSPRLINPLVGLGETYMRGGLYEQANATYRRALQANHVQDGFYNLEQIRILDGLSESYLALEKLGQANAQQRFQVDIQRRRSGPESPEAVAAMQKLGRWYNRTGQYPEARQVFQDTQRVINQSRRGDTTAMVDALLGESVSYENQGAVPDSTLALKRALALLDAQPQTDHVKRAEVLVALGDLYLMSRQPRAGRERYAQAWQELSGDDALVGERDRYFAKPSQISGPLLPTVVDGSGKEVKKPADLAKSLAKGYVVASMSIDIGGDAQDTAIIEADPPGLMDKQVLRALEFAVFRPKMVDGAVVPSEGIQFRHEYRYPEPAPVTQESPLPASSESAGQKGAPIGYPDQPDESKSEPRN